MFDQSQSSQFPALFDIYSDPKQHSYGSLDFSSFHSPADIAAPSIDCFEYELDQLDLLELEVTQVNNAFSQVIPTCGPPSSITLSSESSAHDTLSFYSEPFQSPQTNYSFSLDEMDFQRIRVEDYNNSQSPLPVLESTSDPSSFGPLPPTPPRSPPAKAFEKPYVSRTSFSDYAPPKRNSVSSDIYSQLGYNSGVAQSTISPSHISPVTSSTSRMAEDRQDKGDSRKKYKCTVCPRAFARAYNLKTHMATHDPNRLKPHVCPHASCGRSFSRKHDLGRHLVSIHREDSDTSSHHSASSKVSIGVEKGPRGWCDSCGKGYIGKAGACDCHDVK
ncbi:putative zinc finger, C2H2 type [Lyophyllum shimeji]|uniref:Zinc finger, C2H2 type n=1 Tax=Lyophyllum shimeji TaxID=47721 RepID=A0A9P3PJB7_LYOSH|nr:putative zinc finger, C2H2 type [Lyophyllum shimeji]